MAFHTMDFGAPTCARISERALAIAFEAEPSPALQERIRSLARRALEHDAVAEAVAGLGNLTLFLRSPDDAEALLARLPAWASEAAAAEASAPRTIEIPVRYGGADGPDLPAVAQRCGLAEDEVVRLHAAGEYLVFFLGFQPGFAYLGGLDARLATPRLATPRTEVPAGSVGIGGAQTGVYPRRAPGGWNLIGRTELALFDPFGSPPSLLQAGDRVRFVPV